MGKLLASASASEKAHAEHGGEIDETLRNFQTVVNEFPRVLQTLNEMKAQAATRELAISTLQQGHQKTQQDLERHFQEGKKSLQKLDAIADLLTNAISRPGALLPSSSSASDHIISDRSSTADNRKDG